MGSGRCRVCLSTNEIFEWTINIKDNLTYADLFFAFTKLDKSWNTLEKYNYLCTQCAGVLNSFVDFIDKAHRTDRILRSLTKEKTKGFETIILESSENEKKPNIEELIDYEQQIEIEELRDFEAEFGGDDQQGGEDACSVKDYCDTDCLDDMPFEESMVEDDKADVESYKGDELETVEDFSDEETLKNVSNDHQIEGHNANHSEEADTKKPLYKEVKKLNAKSVQQNSTEERYECMVCGQTLKNKTILNQHIKRKHRNNSFECEVCGKIFKDDGYLKRHMKSHIRRNETVKIVKNTEEDSDATFCEKCSRNYKTNKLLKVHIARMHVDKPRLLCHACPLTFKDQHSLKEHTKRHSKRERNYECEQCGMKFFSLYNCQGHMATHDPDRKPTFHCDQCDKSFFQSGALSTHKRIHGDAGFDCSVCQKRCYRQIDLEIHLRSHTNEKPYNCEECGKIFKYKHMLSDHKRRHAGYKLKCDMCNEEFNNRSTLARHRTKHTGCPLRCGVCNKGFIKLNFLRRHINGVHRITNSEEVQKNICRIKIKNRYKRPTVYLQRTQEEDTVYSG